MEKYELLGLVLVIILGMGWGAFATTAVYRLPLGLPWIGDKPRCILCKHELNIVDYCSVISFFFIRGKCRYCGGKFENKYSYLITEAIIPIGFVICYARYGFSDSFVPLCTMIIAATIAGVIDASERKIPTSVLTSMLILALMQRVYTDHAYDGALYSAFLAASLAMAIRHIYFLIIGKKEIGSDYLEFKEKGRFAGPGFDYVKLLTIISIWLGYERFWYFCIAAAIIMLPWSLIHKKSLAIGSVMLSIMATIMIFDLSI